MINFIDSEESINYLEYYPTLVLLIVTTVLGIVTLASCKKPLVQVRLSIMNCLILLGFQGILVYKYFNLDNIMTMSITAIFPIIAVIISYIIMKFCARDAAILMASTRLRSKRK